MRVYECKHQFEVPLNRRTYMLLLLNFLLLQKNRVQ